MKRPSKSLIRLKEDYILNRWKVPLSDIDIGEEEIHAVTDVLRSRWLSMGPVTGEFERQFAEYVGVKYAFAVANCTAALHLASLAVGLGPGDRAICPSLTFVATANAIRYTGAEPIFADITTASDLNISPEDVQDKIDSSTKAIFVVHYGGYPCVMEQILSVARRHHLYVIEDAAHALGAATCVQSGKQTDQNEVRQCGAIGDIGCFSFFANKNMVTGEGGMLTTNSDDLAGRIRHLRSHGMTTLTWDRDQGHSFSYDVVELGYNYRFDEIRSAIGLIQLKKLELNNQKRAAAVNLYQQKLACIDEIYCPFREVPSKPSYHLFPILLRKGIDRYAFMEFMRTNGIQTSIHYPPVHTLSAYKRQRDSSGNLTVTNDIRQRIVTLPLYPHLDENDIDYVTHTIKAWIRKQRSTIAYDNRVAE
jgi:dTDP-4-amino-4,6-dideoxygalactose transaminase